MAEHPNAPRCHHVRTNGLRCGSPAMRSHKFCYYHKRTSSPQPIPRSILPNLEDGDAIQLGIARILSQIMMGAIEYRAAHLMLDGYRLALRNLKNMNTQPVWKKEVVTVDPAFDPDNASDASEPLTTADIEAQIEALEPQHENAAGDDTETPPDPAEESFDKLIKAFLSQAQQAEIADEPLISRSLAEEPLSDIARPPHFSDPIDANPFSALSESEREAYIMRTSGNKAHFMTEEEMPPAPPPDDAEMVRELLSLAAHLRKGAG